MKQKCFFLRGLIRESGHWSGFLEQFEKAFPHCEAIPLDTPGNGARFRERSPLSVPAMTDAVREIFLTKKAADKNYLFALSLGAMCGLDWLHRFPQDFQGAVLVNTSVRGLSPLHHRLRWQNYGKILRMIFSKDPALFERTILQITSNKQEKFAALEPAWVKIQAARPVSTMNAIRQLIAAARFHPPKEKPNLPLVLLCGLGDQLVNPRCSEALASFWHLPLLTHPTAGHDLTLDEPEWVLENCKKALNLQ